MLHLYKKLYLATDNVIDVNLDRVVISLTHGLKTLDVLTAYHGNLHAFGQSPADIIGDGKKYANWTEMFDALGDLCDETGKKVIIYADNDTFCDVAAHWFKLVFANPDKEACKDLLEAWVFKYKVFNRGRFSRNTSNPEISHEIDISNFEAKFDAAVISPGRRNTFINENGGNLSLEYLLATYLSGGGMGQELKGAIKVLMKKDLEKYLLELKEIFFAHLLTTSFQEKLNLAKTYDWSNFDTIVDDTTTYPDLFMNSRIWKYKFMNFASTGKNVDFDNITDTDVANFKEFTKISGSSWDEENIYKNVKSDINKLDFLDIYSDFTDDRLDTLLDTEASFTNSAGSFFSIDLETVNHYFVQSLLYKWKANDTGFLNKYSIK